MKDPIPFGPGALRALITPLSETLGLSTLPLHIHEILFSYLLYETLFLVVSPLLSRVLFPRLYPRFSARNKLNWDAHVVSLYQAFFINGAALCAIFADPARATQGWPERLWAYNGAAGCVQAFAAGYFLWDLRVSAGHVGVMGVSSLAHAVCALVVTLVGFKPFANYYGLNFVLYELSTPFLNIHWFCDKLSLTGSKIQLYNGILLLASFAGSRLVWGSYQSYSIYKDIWHAWHATEPSTAECLVHSFKKGVMGLEVPVLCRTIPTGLAVFYVVANTALMVLNFYWFGKMVGAVRKRFVPVSEKKERSRGEGVVENGKKEK